MPHVQIVFLDQSTVDLGDLSLSALKKQGVFVGYANSQEGEIRDRLQKAHVAIMNKCGLDASHFAALPSLKLVCVAATGVNNIDIHAAKKRGIAVTNVARYSTTTVAEHTLMLLLAASHRLIEHHRGATEGAWSRSPHFTLLDYPFRDLHGKTLGIIGYGAIGKAVARLAKAFGVKVLIAKLPGRRYSTKPVRYSLEYVLAQSDFVSLHCPLVATTDRLMNRARLKQMKRGAVLLNLARGGVVDEDAVAAALKTGHLGTYATDVTTTEPPPPTHPLFAPELRDKILMTPHIAWASVESRQRLIDEIAQNITAWKRGTRRNRVV